MTIAEYERMCAVSDERTGEPQHLTDTAIEIGEEAICADMELFAEFLTEVTTERKPSKQFGQISTPELVSVLLTPTASDMTLAAAARELRARYVEMYQPTVLQAANRAMEA